MIPMPQITETIQQRFSCRTYQEKPLDHAQVEALTAMLSSPQSPFPGSRMRFELLHASSEDQNSLKKLGTYGTIRNPAGFITGAVKPSRYDMEAFGYRMEEIILFATQQSLGTCWLGGFFSRSSFAKKMQTDKDEMIPAVTSIGWIDDNRTIVDRLMRRQARSHQRLTWDRLFFNESFLKPLEPDTPGAYRTVLEMVRQGPSASNRQPWRIVRQDHVYHFFLQRTPNYPPGFLKLADLQRVDMGIAMCHFALTAASCGLAGEWKESDPGLPAPDERTQYILSWAGA